MCCDRGLSMFSTEFLCVSVIAQVSMYMEMVTFSCILFYFLKLICWMSFRYIIRVKVLNKKWRAKMESVKPRRKTEKRKWNQMVKLHQLDLDCNIVWMQFFLVPGSSCIKVALGDTIPPASPVLRCLLYLVPSNPYLLEILVDDFPPVLTWASSSRPSPEIIGFPMTSLSWDPVAFYAWKMSEPPQPSASTLCLQKTGPLTNISIT